MLPKNHQIHIVTNKEIHKCNTKFFFLVNKKTNFFPDENLFLKFQKIWHLEVAFFLLPDLIQKYVKKRLTNSA